MTLTALGQNLQNQPEDKEIVLSVKNASKRWLSRHLGVNGIRSYKSRQGGLRRGSKLNGLSSKSDPRLTHPTGLAQLKLCITNWLGIRELGDLGKKLFHNFRRVSLLQ
jgi:hypothetical protein